MGYSEILKRCCPLRENVLLAGMTTVGIGGTVPLLLEPRNREELAGALSLLRKEGIPYRILGGGSNILFPDDPPNYVVIGMRGLTRLLRFEEDPPVRRVDAGVTLPRLVSACRKYGLAGAECLAGIPGTVGGALVMNAGGRHGAIADHIEAVTILDEEGMLRECELGPDDFSYRASPFNEGEVVVDARFRYPEDREDAIWDRTRRILSEKKANQPLLGKSLGCVFKNPEGRGAGRLLDEAGMKGMRRGGAQVSEVHANFILNIGDASRVDYLALVEEGKRRVRESFGVDLALEIRIW